MPEVRGSTAAELLLLSPPPFDDDDESNESSSATAAGFLPLEAAECKGVHSSSSATESESAGARERSALTASMFLGSEQTAAWMIVLRGRREGEREFEVMKKEVRKKERTPSIASIEN